MNGKNSVTCYDEINRFLDDYPYERGNGDAIFIHASIISKFCELLSSHGCYITDENAWCYDLCIGAKRYEMYLVWVSCDLLISAKLHMLVSESKYSFPWQSNISIYTTFDKFNLIEKFIEENNLGCFLQNIYTVTNRVCIEADIKVVQFTKDVRRDLLPKFRTFLELNDYKMPNSYFANRAFKYLRPSYLAYFNKPFYNPNMITQVLLMLDYHRAQSEKGNEIFNLFDLIAMKMAIDDNRLDYVNCEFHKLVQRTLKGMSASDNEKSYINSRQFNLIKYHNDCGILEYSEEVYQYLVTQYHSDFDHLKIYTNFGTFKISPKLISNIDRLLSTSRFCNKLNIDIETLNEHNSDVLMKIFTYDGPKFHPTILFDAEETLNTNYAIDVNDNSEKLPRRNLLFKGKNLDHFIENLFNWMRFTLGSRWDNFDLKFKATLIQSPIMLRGLTIRILILKDVRITCKLLRALHHVKYEIIKLSKCYLENDPEIFMLLDALDGDRYIQINIEDHTLGILMDSVKMVLMSGRKEFQFQNYITVYYLKSKLEYIDLSRFKFFINDEGKKIETCDLYTNKTVNIYEYFYKPETAEYDFYN